MAAKKQVLLIDDDVDFLEINKRALESAGFAVSVAHDSTEGLAAARRSTFAVAVLDVIMRRPDEGFELARQLRKEVATQKMPLVMLTSVNQVNSAKGHLFRLGEQDKDDMWLPVDRFVDKPVKPEQLVGILRELIG